jgi:hypothetical protein
VESMIRADLENIWSATQDPHEHVRWDVRFSHIQPSNPGGAGPTQFRYTRTVPFHVVHGVGVSLGEVTSPDGSRTSALRFSTTDRLSPIRSGRGYWRYIPTPAGVRFITGYDYEPGWGPLDVIVRPLVGWATAWSFDRLRIWMEGGAEPERWPLLGALRFWRPDRPRAGRCRRAPQGGHRFDNHLSDAPESLATLPDPETYR